ncbi:metalloprotease [Yersinia nurmii]|nr:metalloprotease [Yersinia nurmii]
MKQSKNKLTGQGQHNENQLESFSAQGVMAGATDRIGTSLKYNKVSFTSEEAVDAITRTGHSWNGMKQIDQSAEVNYLFLNPRYGAKTPAGDSGLTKFNSAQITAAKQAMQSWADVANVTFNEASTVGDANIRFGNYEIYSGQSSNPSFTTGYAYFPWAPSSQVGVWINSNHQGNQRPDLYQSGHQTLSHEIGHALGLSHPGRYDSLKGTPSYRNTAYAEDSKQYSTMSYWSEWNTGADFKGFYPVGPQIDDIAAVQRLYGANMNTRTEDTVYGFNSNTNRDSLSLNHNSDKKVFAVWDADGNDTFDFSAYANNQRINLNEQSFSDVGGLEKNVSIAAGAVIENAIGGSGNDILIGNHVSNLLKGNAGNDVIYGAGGGDHLFGGAGRDTFFYGNIQDSTPENPDTIYDFVSGIEKIDLRGLNIAENSARLVNEFSGKAGEAILNFDETTGMNEFALNHSGGGLSADFTLKIIGQPMKAADFLV